MAVERNSRLLRNVAGVPRFEKKTVADANVLDRATHKPGDVTTVRVAGVVGAEIKPIAVTKMRAVDKSGTGTKASVACGVGAGITVRAVDKSGTGTKASVACGVGAGITVRAVDKSGTGAKASVACGVGAGITVRAVDKSKAVTQVRNAGVSGARALARPIDKPEAVTTVHAGYQSSAGTKVSALDKYMTVTGARKLARAADKCAVVTKIPAANVPGSRRAAPIMYKYRPEAKGNAASGVGAGIAVRPVDEPRVATEKYPPFLTQDKPSAAIAVRAIRVLPNGQNHSNILPSSVINSSRSGDRPFKTIHYPNVEGDVLSGDNIEVDSSTHADLTIGSQQRESWSQRIIEAGLSTHTDLTIGRQQRGSWSQRIIKALCCCR